MILQNGLTFQLHGALPALPCPTVYAGHNGIHLVLESIQEQTKPKFRPGNLLDDPEVVHDGEHAGAEREGALPGPERLRPRHHRAAGLRF